MFVVLVFVLENNVGVSVMVVSDVGEVEEGLLLVV